MLPQSTIPILYQHILFLNIPYIFFKINNLNNKIKFYEIDLNQNLDKI